ncbi:hypothetical protein SteCoe_5632 [Stentor coeruleus]|uniref:MARVEL domain-containing protein n=1 Tax=Stentor coeruleus TaxID=5963 RepID=A0A1R2CRU4_9CILI|nr:hypothetical protein SteCoe_5632 [Stentor coeruleus]
MVLLDITQFLIPFGGLGVFVICQLPFIVAIGIVLGITSGSCTYPISEWLIVWIVITCIITAIITGERYYSYEDYPEDLYLFILRGSIILLVLFLIAWIIIGSVWLYSDDECKTGKGYIDNYSIWVLCLSALIFYYILIGLTLCSGLYLLCKKRNHRHVVFN